MSKDFPLVTIVVISYNQGKYIYENLDSIKNQTYPNIELIVGDDASPDNSVEIFENWLLENNYPTKFKNYHQKNTGLATMLNECVEKANGKYIKLLAADDFLHPEAIEKCVSRLEELGNEYAMVFTDTFVVNDESVEEDKYIGYEKHQYIGSFLNPKELLIANKIPALTVVLSTQILKSTPPYQSDFILEDYAKWLEISKKYKIGFVPEKLAFYRRHSENISKLKIEKIVQEELILQSRYDKLGVLKEEINKKIFSFFEQKKLNPELKNSLRKYPFLTKKSKVVLYFTLVATLVLKFKKSFHFLKFLFSFINNSLKVNTLFFFPFYHTGGAERVHLDIVKSLGKKKSITLFTNYSQNNHFYNDFKNFSYCYCIRPYLNNKYYSKILDFTFKFIGKFRPISTLGCNSMYYYEKLPLFDAKNNRLDLIHAFSYPDLGIEIPSLNFIKYLDKRIVINQKTKLDFEDLYDKNNIDKSYLDRITIINNGVEIPENIFKNHQNKTLEILYCGRISKEKRVNLVVEIGKRLLDKIQLKIFGPLEGNLENINSFYKGQIMSNEKLIDIYNNSNILLITSEREGFPMVIMEAMARGVVCISTNVGGINEHITNGENGFLVDSTSEEEIIDNFVKTINLLDKDRILLKQNSENAYQYAKQNFSIKIFNEKYKTILQNKKIIL